MRGVTEIRPNCPTERVMMEAVIAKLGIGAVETVRTWVRRAEADAGQRPGITSEEAAAIKRLRAENAQLRRADDLEGDIGFVRGRARPAVEALAAFTATPCSAVRPQRNAASSSRPIACHRGTRRYSVSDRGRLQALGLRPATSEGEGQLTGWPAAVVCPVEMVEDRQRETLLGERRSWSTEPPGPTRIEKALVAARN
ncbi:hypothetical protein [Streptomyces sp. NK08204]|uniref:hypothetical protein n=1 Tax=Streptomyces sp. NK08204 TaxID=2873260 RepID=UPI001CEDA3BE|nr:hypothetical protein [Streptomyces sp. NK08204]